jgi:hypothetical protein
LLYDLLAAGRLNDQGRLEVPAAAAESILAKCGAAPAGVFAPSHPSPLSLTGLGDLVAVVAQPIARTIDRVAGTKLQTCGGCKARQVKLNAAIPFRKS